MFSKLNYFETLSKFNVKPINNCNLNLQKINKLPLIYITGYNEIPWHVTCYCLANYIVLLVVNCYQTVE